MTNNNLIIAAAGSGKTTHLVTEALQVKDEKVLITTYTEANEAGIRKKIIDAKGFIPENITIQTWFSFLLQHGVRPFQGALNDSLFKIDIAGMLLVNERSGLKYKGKYGPVYYSEEDDFLKHYFTPSMKIYSDKISKFIVKCDNAAKGILIDRIQKIFKHIYIDEVQDLAGYDLEFIKLLFKSTSKINLVGDPRQVTYLTHNEAKYKKYKDGKIKEFIANELGKKIECSTDEDKLNDSHRNNKEICDYSGRLYPGFKTPKPCSCCRNNATDHEGVFLIKPKDVDSYLDAYPSLQLRWNSRKKVNDLFPVMNFGESKGLTFDRVLIYPTDKMTQWIKNNSNVLKNETKAKLYVGITRAKYSVGIVMNFKGTDTFDGIDNFLMEG